MSKRGAKRPPSRKPSAPRGQTPVAAKAPRRARTAPPARRSDEAAAKADDGGLEVPSLMGARVRRVARRMVRAVLAPVALARAVVERLRRERD